MKRRRKVASAANMHNRCALTVSMYAQAILVLHTMVLPRLHIPHIPHLHISTSTLVTINTPTVNLQLADIHLLIPADIIMHPMATTNSLRSALLAHASSITLHTLRGLHPSPLRPSSLCPSPLRSLTTLPHTTLPLMRPLCTTLTTLTIMRASRR